MYPDDFCDQFREPIDAVKSLLQDLTRQMSIRERKAFFLGCGTLSTLALGFSELSLSELSPGSLTVGQSSALAIGVLQTALNEIHDEE